MMFNFESILDTLFFVDRVILSVCCLLMVYSPCPFVTIGFRKSDIGLGVKVYMVSIKP